MRKRIGILTAGGDSPGLNAAIRAIGKTALASGIDIIGFRDGFRGLAEDRTMPLVWDDLVSLLTLGGTILGTSRDKPHKMLVDGEIRDMTGVIYKNYQRRKLDALLCIGGGGTQKNAWKLAQAGMNILTLPKTIDKDVGMTDVTFGFHTAMEIATEAIDRLHSTAHSHHRIIVVEIMGHNAGWLALGAGVAGGADVILIPEIPYDTEKVAEAIRWRKQAGRPFSIVAVAEGAISRQDYAALQEMKMRKHAAKGEEKKKIAEEIALFEASRQGNTQRLSQQLEAMTGLEARLTILGHLQRGGTPSAADRLLATRLGSACVHYFEEGLAGFMIAVRGEGAEPIPLKDVVGKRSTVPLDHCWLNCARRVKTCLGD
ncbi:MAG: ATP-dependent 6-phosphofructokinase [Desulfobulbaceae bacterium]|jgi:6-phosphofructokinase 1|nr:ATP-dependent 6-phosphofructokinase [Desulfobulbaceae bacterium]